MMGPIIDQAGPDKFVQFLFIMICLEMYRDKSDK